MDEVRWGRERKIDTGKIRRDGNREGKERRMNGKEKGKKGEGKERREATISIILTFSY